MRLDLDHIERELTPLLRVHGVELVALEWLQGPGHGILRVVIDNPGGDPRDQDPEKSVSLDRVTDVTRDVSTAMDALDLIEGSYTLEIGSPGPERPVQKRADYDRFAGLALRLEARGAQGGKVNFRGTLRGTVDQPNGVFAVRVEVGAKVHEIPSDRILRARLQEITQAPKPKPGKGSSRRQERIAAREQARAINAAHLAAKAATASTAAHSDTNEGGATPAGPTTTTELRNDDKAPGPRTSAAPGPTPKA
jgi:ribosome maturation factor RimP